jgi:hypothetical protein
MTRQDRELAIATPGAYVAGVMREVATEWPARRAWCSPGFPRVWRPSRRHRGAGPVDGVIAVGGDVPRAGRGGARPVRSALVPRRAGRVVHDGQVRQRRQALARRAPRPAARVFDGGHEWSDEVVRAASLFLDE